jgi:hypothetical protein
LLPAIRNTSYCKRIQGKLNREPARHQHTSYQQQQQQQQQQQSYFQPPFTYNTTTNVGNNQIHPLMSNHDMNFAAAAATSPLYHQHAFSAFPNP